MAMSKKDYVAVAAIIKAGLAAHAGSDAQAWRARQAVEVIAQDLARYFGSQSQVFDRTRFLKACGAGEG